MQLQTWVFIVIELNVKVVFMMFMNTSQNPQVVCTQARYIRSCVQVVTSGCSRWMRGRIQNFWGPTPLE